MKILKSELNEGVTYLLRSIHGQDAEIFKQNGEFKIWFEGSIIHSSKSYQQLKESYYALNMEHKFKLSAD